MCPRLYPGPLKFIFVVQSSEMHAYAFGCLHPVLALRCSFPRLAEAPRWCV
jgi:hypothetical protein